MRKKRLVSMGLALAMGISLLAGCGNEGGTSNEGDSSNNPQTENNNTNTDNEATGDVDLSEPVELVWYLVGTPQDDQETVFAEVNKVLKEKLNTTVDFNIIDWGSYDDKMQVMIATNEPFDMCFTSDWTNPYVSNAQKNAFYPLTDLLENYGQNIMEQVPESYWGATKVNGEIYGVVNYQVSARINGVSFPADTVEELGYDISQIDSLSDLTDYFEVVAEKKPDMVPFLGGAGNTIPVLNDFETGYLYETITGPVGVSADDPTKAINLLETDKFMELCKLKKEWYDKGYVRKDVASITDSKAEVKTHNYAAFETGVGPGSPETESNNAGFTVVQAQTYPAMLSTGSIQAALTAISANCEHPERAMMVLDYLFEDKETYNMLCYGIEGTHWEKVNDYSLRVIEEGGYNPGIAWEFGSWFNAMLLEGQAEDLWDQLKEVNATALTSPTLGFVYDSTNVKTETAQVTALMDEYMPGLNAGSVDPEVVIPELNEKLKEAGIDKIMEDLNTQLETWVNSQE